MKTLTRQKLLAAVCALVAATGLRLSEVQAGKVFQCTDAQGNLYFTDVACPTEMRDQGTVANTQTQAPARTGPSRGQTYNTAPSYQAPPTPTARGYSPEEQLERLEAQKVQLRQRQAAEYERWQAQQGPGYSDETAARNAMVTIRSERELPNRHYKPKNAAEMAIEYNAESVAGGGRHQVRVPDVYETHIHYNDSRGDGTSRPCVGANDFNCVKKW